MRRLKDNKRSEEKLKTERLNRETTLKISPYKEADEGSILMNSSYQQYILATSIWKLCQLRCENIQHTLKVSYKYGNFFLLFVVACPLVYGDGGGSSRWPLRW